jgi:hypothetical protein
MEHVGPSNATASQVTANDSHRLWIRQYPALRKGKFDQRHARKAKAGRINRMRDGAYGRKATS